MKKKPQQLSLRRIVFDTLPGAFSFLAKKPLIKKEFKIMKEASATFQREVALLIQFTGKAQGELVLSTARKTAQCITRAFSRAHPSSGEASRELECLKQSLGELLNIVASRLLAKLPGRSGISRVTTPSCIFGRGLSIMTGRSRMFCLMVATPYGLIDFSLFLEPD